MFHEWSKGRRGQLPSYVRGVVLVVNLTAAPPKLPKHDRETSKPPGGSIPFFHTINNFGVPGGGIQLLSQPKNALCTRGKYLTQLDAIAQGKGPVIRGTASVPPWGSGDMPSLPGHLPRARLPCVCLYEPTAHRKDRGGGRSATHPVGLRS